MRLLKASDYTRMPWKNGGGETIEIAVHPPGAGLTDFDWRVSTARVTQDGTFSAFEGIDRTLCLLAGTSLDLEIAGLGARCLTPACPPLSFPADVATVARLREGAISDLNVMSRRGVWEHRVARKTITGSVTIHLRSAWNAIVLMDACRIDGDDVRADAHAGDTLIAGAAAAPITIEVPKETTIFQIGFCRPARHAR